MSEGIQVAEVNLEQIPNGKLDISFKQVGKQLKIFLSVIPHEQGNPGVSRGA